MMNNKGQTGGAVILAAVMVVTAVIGLVVVDGIVHDTASTSAVVQTLTSPAATTAYALDCSGNPGATSINVSNDNANASFTQGAHYTWRDSTRPGQIALYANFTNQLSAANATAVVRFNCQGMESTTTQTVLENAPIIMGVALLALAGGWLWFRG